MSKVPVPANLIPFVEALGADLAIQLFLKVGGSEIYLPQKSSQTSKAALAIGADGVDKLVNAIGYGYIKVPLARKWVAFEMDARGISKQEIARQVRADYATVRRWFDQANTNQINLF